MTREESKESILGTLKAQNKITDSTIEYVHNNIDKLADSYEIMLKERNTEIKVLENRSCNRCRHLIQKSRICLKKIQLHDGGLPRYNFYCSEYKSKVDSISKGE